VEEDEIKTDTSPQICCCTTLWKASGHVYSFTSLTIHFKVLKNI